MGLSSRIIDALFYGGAESSSVARDRIYLQMWNAIMARPYTGYGIFGENVLFGYNAHNIFYGVFIHFGFVFGSVVLLWLLIRFVKAAIVAIDNNVRGLFFVLLCNGLIRCFFSGTYLCFPLFLALGFAVNVVRQSRTTVI